MRFRVMFQQYANAQSLKHGATLEENDPDPEDGEDCWENVVSVSARSEADALRILKEYVVRDNEERLQALKAVMSEMIKEMVEKMKDCESTQVP